MVDTPARAGAGAERGDEVIPDGLRCLLEAYPTQLCGATSDTLIWCDGTRMPWDDGVERSTHEERLNHADLRDQMAQPYPIGSAFVAPPAVNSDPGRLRDEAFFRKMYGDSREAVRETLKTVIWLPKHVGARVKVTTVNGVAKALQAVSDEVDRLPKKIRDVVAKQSGTFVWRKIGGTTRLSMHSFALAIDVGVRFADYWKWAKKRAKEGEPFVYRNRIPLEVVEIFERHGFIWGGKWYHFDTMHFEYRPELLMPRCAKTPEAPPPP